MTQLLPSARSQDARPGYTPPMPRRHGRTICPVSGKLRYGDQLTAERAIAKAVVSGDPRRREVRAYPCPHCDCWHLTSREARRA